LEKIEDDLLKFSKLEKALKAKGQSRQRDLF